MNKLRYILYKLDITDEGKPILPAVLMRLAMLVLLLSVLGLASFLILKVSSKFHPNGWHIFGFIILMVLLAKLIPVNKSNKTFSTEEKPIETKDPV
ncbi:hypothetical protein [Pedobacter agri]|uniref:hypothetical protein n=1 Tax=Pedobacter agri TaxID=454586 RepID=UPI00292CE4D4|nr:hypothetical protein [Pedobacter agri]